MESPLDIPCSCQAPGYCPIFQRFQTARDYAVCQRGDGKTERERVLWLKERSGERLERPRKRPKGQKGGLCPGFRKLILRLGYCPGDVVCATGAIESLARAYPGEFSLWVDAGSNQPILDHNPWLTRLDEGEGVSVWDWHFPAIDRSNLEPISFLSAWTEDLGKALGIDLRLSVNRPYLYLSDREKYGKRLVSSPYVVINAGSKGDFETKQIPWETYQGVVKALQGKIQFVQIGKSGDRHRKLEGVIDLVDKTDFRQLMVLVYHSSAAIGPTTFLCNLCAAFEKPYILCDSAREPVAWINYPNIISLVKRNSLPCCQGRGCWKSKIRDPYGTNDSCCERPYWTGESWVSECSALITVGEIVSVFENLLSGGVISRL